MSGNDMPRTIAIAIFSHMAPKIKRSYGNNIMYIKIIYIYIYIYNYIYYTYIHIHLVFNITGSSADSTLDEQGKALGENKLQELKEKTVISSC